jgi:hypothetical protein
MFPVRWREFVDVFNIKEIARFKHKTGPWGSYADG